MGFWAGAGGPIVSGALGAAGSLLGRGNDNWWNNAAGNWIQWNKANDQWEATRRDQNQQWAANFHQQERFARHSTGWQFDDLMQSADEAGIHRLAALGGASAYQAVPSQAAPGQLPSASNFDQPGNSGGELGDAILNGLQAFTAAKKMQHDVKMDEEQLKLMQAERKQMEAETSRTIASNARNNRNIDPSTVPQSIADWERNFLSLDPEDVRVDRGPLKGRYLIRLPGGQVSVSSATMAPKEQVEAIFGEVPSELGAIYNTISATLSPVRWNKEKKYWELADGGIGAHFEMAPSTHTPVKSRAHPRQPMR